PRPPLLDDGLQVGLLGAALAQLAAVERGERLCDAGARRLLGHLQAQDESPDALLGRLAHLALGEHLRGLPRHEALARAGLTGDEEQLARPQPSEVAVEER